MKNYSFRAVYFKNRKDGEVDYYSAPINEAEEPYNTLGVYDLTEGDDDIEQRHIADMPREDFQLVLDSRFPNGFKSWQKSHYEIVLSFNKQINEKENSSFLHHLNNHIKKEGWMDLVLTITDKYEANRKKKSDQTKESLHHAIDEIVKNEIHQIGTILKNMI